MQRLGREWRRRTLMAICGAAVVPAAVVIAALTSGIGGGGIAGLDSLAQALTGPRLPDAGAAGAESQEAQAARERQLRALPARRRVARDGDRRGGTRSPAPPRAVGGPVGGPGRPARPSPGRVGPRPGGSAPPAGTPAPRPTPTPGPVRRAGDQIRGVVRPVPGAGPVADKVIGDAVDQVEPTPTPTPTPTATPTPAPHRR